MLSTVSTWNIIPKSATLMYLSVYDKRDSTCVSVPSPLLSHTCHNPQVHRWLLYRSIYYSHWEIPLVCPHPPCPPTPRSHINTGVSVITTQQDILWLNPWDWCIEVTVYVFVCFIVTPTPTHVSIEICVFRCLVGHVFQRSGPVGHNVCGTMVNMSQVMISPDFICKIHILGLTVLQCNEIMM